VLMSVAEYESWKETNEILNDPGLMKAIKQGEREIKEGKGTVIHNKKDLNSFFKRL